MGRLLNCILPHFHMKKIIRVRKIKHFLEFFVFCSLRFIFTTKMHNENLQAYIWMYYKFLNSGVADCDYFKYLACDTQKHLPALKYMNKTC